MNTIMWIILGLALIGLFVSILFTIQYLYGSRKKGKDGIMILNLRAHLFKEPALGTQINSEKGNDGRELVTIIPKDILNEVDKVEPVKVIKDREFYADFPAGTLSEQRSIGIIFPKNASEFHPIWRKTFIGNAFMFAVEMKNAEDSINASIKAGSKAKSDFMEVMGDGELSRQFIMRSLELIEDMKKVQDSAKKDQTTPGIPGFKKPEA